MRKEKPMEYMKKNSHVWILDDLFDIPTRAIITDITEDGISLRSPNGNISYFRKQKTDIYPDYEQARTAAATIG